MIFSLMLSHVAFYTSILSQEIPTGVEPFTIPPLTALGLVIILIAVLVLALYYNSQVYQPPQIAHSNEERAGGGDNQEHD
jgi:hypothetical protein